MGRRQAEFQPQALLPFHSLKRVHFPPWLPRPCREPSSTGFSSLDSSAITSPLPAHSSHLHTCSLSHIPVTASLGLLYVLHSRHPDTPSALLLHLTAFLCHRRDILKEYPQIFLSFVSLSQRSGLLLSPAAFDPSFTLCLLLPFHVCDPVCVCMLYGCMGTGGTGPWFASPAHCPNPQAHRHLRSNKLWSDYGLPSNLRKRWETFLALGHLSGNR